VPQFVGRSARPGAGLLRGRIRPRVLLGWALRDPGHYEHVGGRTISHHGHCTTGCSSTTVYHVSTSQPGNTGPHCPSTLRPDEAAAAGRQSCAGSTHSPVKPWTAGAALALPAALRPVPARASFASLCRNFCRGSVAVVGGACIRATALLLQRSLPEASWSLSTSPGAHRHRPDFLAI